MMLYDILLSSNRLTPEESVMLTPFLGKAAEAGQSCPIKFLKELTADSSMPSGDDIRRFLVSKKTAIHYSLTAPIKT